MPHHFSPQAHPVVTVWRRLCGDAVAAALIAMSIQSCVGDAVAIALLAMSIQSCDGDVVAAALFVMSAPSCRLNSGALVSAQCKVSLIHVHFTVHALIVSDFQARLLCSRRI